MTQSMKAVRLLLPQKSPRWLNLTANLWELIVQHAHRAVDEEGLSNFLDVLGWRIHNKITEEELSVLFYDWISPSAVAQTSNASPNRKDGTYDFKLDIGTFRCLLIDRKCNDPDLDLIIGMSVLELNRILVNVPISFNARKSGMGNGIPALELCSHQWIALSEELFFLLDTKGYGCLRFEEVFFLASCFATGLKGWTDISDAQTDMLTSVLSAIALQTMMESGAKPLLAYSRLLVSAVSPMKRGGYNGEAKGTTKAATKKQSVPSYAREKQRRKKEDNPDTDANNNKKKVKAGKDKALADSQHISASISLPMFKSYLLRKAVNAVALQELVAHIKNSIRDFWEVISVMAKVEQPSMNTFKEVLEVSLAGGNDIGSLGTPQLWEWAVLRASGFKSPSLLSTRNSAAQNIVNGSPGDNSDPPPAVVLFLLSDGEALVSGSLRATEATITSQSIASLRKGLQVSPIKSPSSVHPKSPSAQGMRAQGLQVKPDPREELLLTAEYLWLAYQAWGAIPQPYTFDRLEELKNSLKGGDVEMIETTRDPVYMLIIAVLLEYKLLQKQLVAVLLALASTKFKSEQAIATDPFDSPAAAQAAATMLSDTSSILSLACATLLPDAENMFEELGLNYSNTEDHSNDKKLADHYSSPSRAGQFNARKNSSASANAAGTAGREKISPNTEHIELKKLYTARSRFDGYEGPGDDGNRDDQYLDDDDYGDDFDANLDEFISENNDDLDEVQDAVEDCDESGLSSPPLSPPRHPPPPFSGPTSPEAVPENYRSRSHRLSNLQQQAASAAFPKAMKPDEVLKFQFEAAMSQQASSVAAATAKSSSPNRMPTSSKPTVSIPPLNIGEKPFIAKDRQETYRNSVTSTISSTLSVNVELPGSGGTGVTLSNSRSRFAHRLSDASSEEKSNVIAMDTSTNPSKTAAAAAVAVTTDTVAITKGTGQGRHHRRSIEDREKELLDALLRAKSSVEQQALIDELRKLRERLAPGNGDEEVVDKELVLTETNSDQAPSLLPIAATTATGTTSDGMGIVSRVRDTRKVGEDTGVDKGEPSDVQLAPNSIDELLEQGRSAGMYATILRETLRQMSHENVAVQLKTLECLIELGEDDDREAPDSVPSAEEPPALRSSTTFSRSNPISNVPRTVPPNMMIRQPSPPVPVQQPQLQRFISVRTSSLDSASYGKSSPQWSDDEQFSPASLPPVDGRFNFRLKSSVLGSSGFRSTGASSGAGQGPRVVENRPYNRVATSDCADIYSGYQGYSSYNGGLVGDNQYRTPQSRALSPQPVSNRRYAQPTQSSAKAQRQPALARGAGNGGHRVPGHDPSRDSKGVRKVFGHPL